MKKILFIQPHKTVLSSDLDRGDSEFLAKRTDKFARTVPSLPAMIVLGALKDHETYFIDATADDPANIFPYNEHISLLGLSDNDLCDRINDIKPDQVLLTSMFTLEYFVVNKIGRLIKDMFKLPMIIGGHHAKLRPTWHDCLDAVINDKVFSLDQQWEIKNVILRKDGSTRYPLASTTRNPELYLPLNTKLTEPTGVLYASRGCPYACNYCNATDRDGRKIRHISLEHMIKLTEEFMEYGATTFHNESDTFGTHPIDREYLRWAGEKGINLVNTNSFFAKFFFPDKRFSPERVDLLKKAGFKTITITIDSFNEKYNTGKLKNITVEKLQDCVAYIKEQGLNVDIYMMYLFPEQTDEELKEDKAKAEKLDTTITWRSLTYFPDTPYYKWAIKTGKFTEEEYRKSIEKGHSFYHPDERFNFSEVSKNAMQTLPL